MGAAASKHRNAEFSASGANDYLLMPGIVPPRKGIMLHHSEEADDTNQLPEELQRRLIVAMIYGDERKFRERLSKGAAPERFRAHHCIATACWRDRYAKFVKILLEAGLDQNAKIPNSVVLETFPVWLDVYDRHVKVTIEDDANRCRGRTPVHLAAGAGNPQVLRQLLSKSDTNCNAKDSQGETPLHYATCARYHVAGSGQEQYAKCVDLILQRKDIGVNCANAHGWTAAHLAALRGSTCVLSTLLADDRVDANLKDMNDRTLLHLLAHYEDIPDQNIDYIEACLTLILYESVTDVNSVDRDGNTALHLAAKSANILILKTLAKRRTTDMMKLNGNCRNLLHCVAESRVKDTERIKSCLDFLLDWQDNKTFEKLEVNHRDVWGYTPVHVAIIRRNHTAALSLMKRGACLCERSDEDRRILDDMSPETLEAFFDSCLEQSGEPYDKSFKITFKYKFLPPRVHPKSYKCSGGEMSVINCISQKIHLRHLLVHPLVRSFLHLKYKRLRMLVYLNIMIYILFVTLINSYISMESSSWGNITMRQNSTLVDQMSENSRTKVTLRAGIVILIACLGIREIIQITLLHWKYFNGENFLELLTLVLAAVITWDAHINTTWQRYVCVTVLILSWVELILLTGRLPTWSVQYEMLKTVLATLLTYLVWFLIILTGFAMCFHVLFIVGTSDDFFALPWLSLVRTIVMMTGEFEFTGLPFDNLPFISDFVFLSFVVLVFFAMLNLLNGLAVSDTQKIREEALQLSVVSRVRLVSFMEEAFAHQLRLPFARRIGGFFRLFSDAARDEELVHVVRPNLMFVPDYWQFRLRVQYLIRSFLDSDMDIDIVDACKERLDQQHQGDNCLGVLAKLLETKGRSRETTAPSSNRQNCSSFCEGNMNENIKNETVITLKK
ncbi:transient receptor potential channel pyrexia-like [Bacillus rossius redtenbacheri]|uniref:transient receptor potential channel pyrexia-like n=1 Tax=Bacillus rossius redtenbacheri TaxID=93214 RepID=UPI002FDE67A0